MVWVRSRSAPNCGECDSCVVERWTDINDTFMSPAHWQLSISACADLQRAWEGPRGSLTAILCRFLGQRTLLEYGHFRAMNLTDIRSQRKTLTRLTAR